ncbi:MAG: hypothetical protein U0903_15375, partial [Planctomycetales bacterium]
MQQSASRRDGYLRSLSLGALSALMGAAISLLLLAFALQVSLLWGYSPRIALGMLWSIPFCFAILSLRAFNHSPLKLFQIALPCAGVSLLAWPTLAVLDLGFAQTASLLAAYPVLQPVPAFSAFALLAAEFILLLWASTRIPATWVSSQPATCRTAVVAAGAALSLVIAPSLLELTGLFAAQYLAALLSMFVALPAFITSKQSASTDSSPATPLAMTSAPVALALVAAASGFLWTAWHRIATQLILETANFLTAEYIGLSAGLALGITVARLNGFRNLNPTTLLRYSLIASSLLIALCLFRYDSLIAGSLWINTAVSSTFMAYLFRVPFAAFGPFLIGLNASLLLSGFSFNSSAKSPHTLSLFALVALLAATLSQALLPSVGPAVWALIAVLCLTAASLAFISHPGLFAVRPANLVVIAGVVPVLLAIFGLRHYQPAKAAQILFSTNMTQARISGHGLDVLQYLDDTRFHRQFEGDLGTITLWTRRGSQMQIRANGVPKGVTTQDTRQHPHYTAEILAATLPMVLHEQAHDVLLLGLGSGSPLGALLASPVQHLDCIEPDRTLVDVVKHATVDPHWIDWHDDRLSLQNSSPLWWNRAHPVTYDVILANPEQSSLLPLASGYTREFYQSASRALRPSGIFCQRFITMDYGAAPWEQALRTISSSFSHVLAIDTAQGEVLLLGSNDPRGLVREGFVKRLKAGQVGETLAVLGWDWSLPLTLATSDPHSQELISPATSVNSARQGNFLFGWSRELSRWGIK